MTTRYDCRDPQSRIAGVDAAVTAARAGELIVLPTDTVYGIGADAFDKAWDDLSKGGIWTVNDGAPKDFVNYTIQKKIELGTQGMPNDLKYEQVVDLSVVIEAIKRLGGPMSGDPRWY